ncbi:MAG: alpha/beta hydrolase [Solirubrobacterales bacterium]|nr:alpha/beta hydrolase [Solirubrobacterales bacterium]
MKGPRGGELETGAGERFTRVGEIRLCYESFGERGAPPVVLVMGLGSQMVLWDDDFCRGLADRGFFVTRFDNRDAGRSTILRHLPVPTRAQVILRDPRAAAYSLVDMAADAAGLIERLELGAVHLVGASMGAMIAQLVAIHHPERVRSLVSIMSTTGGHRVGRAQPRMYARLLRRPRRGREGYIEDFVETHRALGSRRYPGDERRLRARAARCFARGYHPAGTARQLQAVVTAPDRTAALGRLRMPVTVIHGGADPLVSPSGGHATAAAIPGARLLILPDMGHDLPPELWPQILDAIVENAHAANGGPRLGSLSRAARPPAPLGRRGRASELRGGDLGAVGERSQLEPGDARIDQ